MTAQPQSDYGDPVHVCHEGDLPAVGPHLLPVALDGAREVGPVRGTTGPR